MNRSQLTLLALVSAGVLAPCHADQPVARATMPAKAAVAPARSVIPVQAPAAAPTTVPDINRAALNPQPLPPGPPDPDRLRDKNGIIIIGGTPAQSSSGNTKKAPVRLTPIAPKPAEKKQEQRK